MEDETAVAGTPDDLTAAAGGSPRMWRRLVAELLIDSRAQRRAVGTRAIISGYPRLLYMAGCIEIGLDLRLGAVAGQRRILGQITADEEDLAGASVRVEGVDGRWETTVDDFGQFALDGLIPGGRRLEIGLLHALIEIPAVRL
jgi:hypothetical protein